MIVFKNKKTGYYGVISHQVDEELGLDARLLIDSDYPTIFSDLDHLSFYERTIATIHGKEKYTIVNIKIVEL